MLRSWPPSAGPVNTRVRHPALAQVRAAVRPAMPPPAITTSYSLSEPRVFCTGLSPETHEVLTGTQPSGARLDCGEPRPHVLTPGFSGQGYFQIDRVW